MFEQIFNEKLRISIYRFYRLTKYINMIDNNSSTHIRRAG